MEKCVVVLDFGSTNVKAVAFDTAGGEIALSSCPKNKAVSPKPGWWEQDPREVWAGTAKAIRGIFEKNIKPENVLGVFATGQGNGLISVDKNRNPVGMGIVSVDSRAQPIVDAWRNDNLLSAVHPTLGMSVYAGGPLSLMAWLRENSPERYGRTDKILFAKDWINFKLSGVVGTDRTDASGAGLMDIRKDEYAFEVFDLLGMKGIADKLPSLHFSHEKIGTVTKEAAAETGLLEGTPVMGGAHDLGAFPFGVGTTDSKQLVSVIGTWGFNLFPVKNPDGYSLAFTHSVPGYFLTGIGDPNSGACLDKVIDILCEHEKVQATMKNISVHDYIEDMIIGLEPSGIVFHPYLFANIFSVNASAGFYGVKNWHTKADLLRAVYEGIIMGHYANIKTIPGNEKFESIWLIGGGAKSRVLGQIFADVTGLGVKIPVTDEVTGRGGALNALVGLGVYKSHEEAAIPVGVKTEFKQDPNRRDFHSRKFDIFRELITHNMEIWNRLGELKNYGQEEAK